jgi:hypothetical protein
MNTTGVRAEIYLRVSRDDQTTENQRLVLDRVAGHRSWIIVQTYQDAGVSGAISVPPSMQRSRTLLGDGSTSCWSGRLIDLAGASSTSPMPWRNSAEGRGRHQEPSAGREWHPEGCPDRRLRERHRAARQEGDGDGDGEGGVTRVPVCAKSLLS